MGKKNRKKKEPVKQAQKPAPKGQSSSIFERLDNYLGKRHKLVAYLITLVALILSLLMFDAKISTGLDDSTYIVEGYKYSQDTEKAGAAVERGQGPGGHNYIGHDYIGHGYVGDKELLWRPWRP